VASLKDIKLRIGSVKNTQQITKAMKMVSAAKLNRAQNNITNLRPYAMGLLGVIADVAKTNRIEHPLLEQKTNPRNVLLVVVTSDRGLCAGFNSNINKYAETYYKENVSQLDKLDLFVIGRRALDYFNRRDIKSVDHILNMAKDISYDMASEVAEKIIKGFLSGDYDEIRFIYNEFQSVLVQERTSETILPVDLENSAFASEDDNRFSEDLIFEPKPEDIIEVLLKKHFTVQVYRILSESIAAEHAARMTAMDSATNNAKDMISNLTLTYNKLRQAAITTELTEICSGAEALKG